MEWFGIKVIHALPYRGRSKTIESIWNTIDREWIRPLPGYCGSTPNERPFILEQLHSIVLQTDLADQVCHIPPVDNIRYGQAIDTERDSTIAADDKSIPEELKEKAAAYSRNLMSLESPLEPQGKITQTYRELDRKLRESKGKSGGGEV